MIKALFFNIPAHGHINASLPLVTELARRGHEITYYTTTLYRQRVESTGTSVRIYANLEDDYFEKRGLDGSAPPKAAEALLRTTLDILPHLIEEVHKYQPDYILYDCMCPWGYYLAQIAGIPSISSFSLPPISLQMMRNWHILRLFLPSLLREFETAITINRLRLQLAKTYRVKAIPATEVLNIRGDLSISYSSKYYIRHSDTLPDSFRFIGWAPPPDTEENRFIHESKQPLIYISLGTVISNNKSFYLKCIEAFASSPYAVLITTGGSLESGQFGILPANITIKSWVPQIQVLKQAALFITHAGINSLHEGLYFNLPLLLVPQQSEQIFNAMRVAELGAGLMIHPQNVTAANLLASANVLLSHDQYRVQATRIGDSLRTGGGVAKAADEIEKLLRRHKNIHLNQTK